MNLPLNIDVRQILLHMLNFVILFGGMYFILYNPVKKFMNARSEKYKADSEKAEKLLSEAKAAREEYEKKLSSADAEIAEKKALAASELEKAAQASRDAAERKANAIIASAEERARARSAEIEESAKKEICEMAAAAAEKIVYKNSSDAYDGFLDGIENYDEQDD